MTDDRSKQFRPVNQSLGQQPNLGPIPATLLAPSAAILVISYFLVKVVLSLEFVWFLLVSAWGMSTWWLVVGEKTWRFTNKFVSAPDWNRGYVHYTSCLPHEEDDNEETGWH
jgi:hypothetical protein